jgi:predicted nuclease of restriction endonuclease-like (RecB) superfamily
MKNKAIKPLNKQDLYLKVKEVLEAARSNAYRAVNFAMVQAYWNIGRLIVEEEQKGKDKAGYGEAIIKDLSAKLTKDFGIGFTITNLKYFRQFYMVFRIGHALRGQLTWTHYRLLLKVNRPDIRDFYIQECIDNNWSTRQLERQINSFYYERLLSSKNKSLIRKDSKQTEPAPESMDIIKDPYVLEFLAIADKSNLVEKELEQALLDKLQSFLLELGKGFSFVARQKRITLDGDHFYIDLIFYNYILKCFVLIDLKVGKLTHQDIGQMDFYVRYCEKEMKHEEDNPTIGIILCAEKNDAMVKYSILNENKKLFASKYMLYLPTEEELKKELMREKEQVDMETKVRENS